ncbi:DUF5819 family protein [Nocardiopsis sp. NPDC058631]|uniref:DUF5819 family protein n=1 Tax=Nocardiopsis sp. NPDC058631 TaxID=3346566 RepID=UPI00365CD068
MDVKESPQNGSGPTPQESDEETTTPRRRATTALALKAGLRIAVVLCVVTTLAHVILVFLHVAPSNTVSQRYSQQVNAWVYPLFEQNWRLFAPDPDSVNQQISARTAHTAPDGSVQVSDWFDLTAVDNSAVEHNIFPSHTSQNMLRRSWTSYLESHGGGDESYSEHAVLMQKYLCNIAAARFAEHNGGSFEHIQLRVRTLPIAAPGTTDADRSPGTSPAPIETRLLPWWKVTLHGN